MKRARRRRGVFELGDAAFGDGDVDAILGAGQIGRRRRRRGGGAVGDAPRPGRGAACFGRESVGLGFEGALALEAERFLRGVVGVRRIPSSKSN